MTADTQRIEIPCPACGHVTIRSVRWIKRHERLTCWYCRAVINLQREELAGAIWRNLGFK